MHHYLIKLMIFSAISLAMAGCGQGLNSQKGGGTHTGPDMASEIDPRW